VAAASASHPRFSYMNRYNAAQMKLWVWEPADDSKRKHLIPRLDASSKDSDSDMPDEKDRGRISILSLLS
jgi:hypothetical protein